CRTKGDDAVVADQLGLLKQGQSKVGAGLAIIIGIAQLQRSASIVGSARHGFVRARSARVVDGTMPVRATELFGVIKSPGVLAPWRTRAAVGRFMRTIGKKSSQLPGAHVRRTFCGE